MEDTGHLRPFQRDSSDVDWCESNYQISSIVAEFWNTVSNVLFFIIPLVMVNLQRQYHRRVNRGAILVWILYPVVGVGSVYYHATLSLAGQLLDEISILWVITAGIATLWPKCYIPVFLKQDRAVFQKLIAVCVIICTGLSVLMPVINHLLLSLLGIPVTVVYILQLRKVKCPRVKTFGRGVVVVWVLALTSWITDRIFCHAWQAIHFPYMHSLWHIFIAIVCAQCAVILSYLDALEEAPDQLPVMHFWPVDRVGLFVIPYVQFRAGPNKSHSL